MWFKFVLFVLLLPFKILLYPFSFMFWQPSSLRSFIAPASGKDVDQKYFDALGELDLSVYMNNGDGPKFVGLLYAATRNENHWLAVKSFWQNGCFVRYLRPDLNESGDNFSGDMISGMMEAILIRLKEKKLTNQELLTLKGIWENTIFVKPYFKFKNINGRKNEKGVLWSPLSFGNECLQIMAFLALGYELFNDERYKILYDRIRFWSWLILPICDLAIFIKRIYAASWYDEHSQMAIYSAGYWITGDEVFRSAAKKLANRYITNPDIQGYCYKYIDGNQMRKEIAIAWLGNYDLETKGTLHTLPMNICARYFSLLSFKTKVLSRFILPTQYRGGLYMWESKDIEPSENIRGATIDYIHLFSLVQ